MTHIKKEFWFSSDGKNCETAAMKRTPANKEEQVEAICVLGTKPHPFNPRAEMILSARVWKNAPVSWSWGMHAFLFIGWKLCKGRISSETQSATLALSFQLKFMNKLNKKIAFFLLWSADRATKCIEIIIFRFFFCNYNDSCKIATFIKNKINYTSAIKNHFLKYSEFIKTWSWVSFHRSASLQRLTAPLSIILCSNEFRKRLLLSMQLPFQQIMQLHIFPHRSLPPHLVAAAQTCKKYKTMLPVERTTS